MTCDRSQCYDLLFTDGTSYESYDEDAEVNTREVVYENQLAGHDILLPR